MAKQTLFLACLTLGLFGTVQSVSFHFKFYSGGWGILGNVYQASVQNSVTITSPDAAQIDSISGTHLDGYNNDNVEVFILTIGQSHFFPRGLNKIFKNLKGIQITGTGLKELHQADLKVFPNLRQLSMSSTNLEILEANLFEYNLNLELISLSSNKISHIDPNLFDKLTKLKTLYLGSNTCINMDAAYNPTAVQNVIKTVKSQCTNSNYLNLEQKVKNLEAESQNLNSKNLKEKFENLENEIKNSKFSNFFRDIFEGLKLAQVQKAQDETMSTTTRVTEIIKFETCSALESKFDEMAANLKDLKAQISIQTCSNKNPTDNSHCEAFRDDLRNQTEVMDTRMEILGENLENFKISALREIFQIKAAVKEAHYDLKTSLNVKIDKFEKQIKEQNQKFEIIEENLKKIMKTLKIVD